PDDQLGRLLLAIEHERQPIAVRGEGRLAGRARELLPELSLARRREAALEVERARGELGPVAVPEVARRAAEHPLEARVEAADFAGRHPRPELFQAAGAGLRFEIFEIGRARE